MSSVESEKQVSAGYADYETARKPDVSLIREIRDNEIDLAMMLAGTEAYERWRSNPELADDLGELITEIYASMEAQKVAVRQQIDGGADMRPISSVSSLANRQSRRA